MGFDILSVIRNPPHYLPVLVGLAAMLGGAMLFRLLRRHRHGSDRVQIRLSD